LGKRSVGYRVLRGMLVVLFFLLFRKLGGFVVMLVLSRWYPEESAEQAAFLGVYKELMLPLIWAGGLKILLPAIVPLFVEERREHGEAAAWDFANTVLNLVMAVTLVLAVGMILGARGVVQVYFPGFVQERPEAFAPAVRLLRIMAAGAGGLILSLLLQSLLNSYKQFGPPAAAEASQRAAWIAILLAAWVVTGLNLVVIAGGFVIGCVMQAAVNAFGLRAKLRSYRLALPALPWRRIGLELVIVLGGVGAAVAAWFLCRSIADPQARAFRFSTVVLGLGFCYLMLMWFRAKRRLGIMGRFVALAAPLAIGILFARYRDLINVQYQSLLKSEQFSLFTKAKTLCQMPIDLFALAISAAILPYLCELSARREMDTFADLMTKTLRLLALVFVPLTVMVVLLGGPIMRIVWDQGAWGATEVYYARLAMGLYAVGLFVYAVEPVVMQSFFSMQNVWWPIGLGLAATAFHVGFLLLLVEGFQMRSPDQLFIPVALSFPVSRIFKNVILIAVLKRRVREVFPARRTLVFFLKLLALTAGVGAVTGLTAGPVASAFPLVSPGAGGSRMTFLLDKTLHFAIPFSLGAGAGVAILFALQFEEARDIVAWVRRKGWRELRAKLTRRGEDTDA